MQVSFANTGVSQKEHALPCNARIGMVRTLQRRCYWANSYRGTGPRVVYHPFVAEHDRFTKRTYAVKIRSICGTLIEINGEYCCQDSINGDSSLVADWQIAHMHLHDGILTTFGFSSQKLSNLITINKLADARPRFPLCRNDVLVLRGVNFGPFGSRCRPN